jgi:hypothetical protein
MRRQDMPWVGDLYYSLTVPEEVAVNHAKNHLQSHSFSFKTSSCPIVKKVILDNRPSAHGL